MAVDIEGFDIVFSAANAKHARAIDQSIASMSEKVPTLSMGISEMAKANKIDGIIGITYSEIDKYLTSDMPFVSIDRRFGAGIPCVSSNNRMGGWLAARIAVDSMRA